MITKLSEITKIVPNAQEKECLFVLKPFFLNSYSNIEIKACEIIFSFEDKRETWEKTIDSKLLKIKDNLFPNRDYNCAVMKSGRTFCRSGVPVALSTREFKYIQEITINWKIEIHFKDKDVIENYSSHIPIRIVHKHEQSVFVIRTVDLPQTNALKLRDNRDCVFFGLIPYQPVPAVNLNTDGQTEFHWSRTKGISINSSQWSEHEAPTILKEYNPFK
jgi:hypothetical protein